VKLLRTHHLQSDLGLHLMLPVLVIVVMIASLGVFGAQHHVDTVFDRWLLDAARSLAAQVRVVNHRAVIALSAQSEALLTFDVVDRTSFEVLEDNRHVFGQTGIPRSGEHEKSFEQGERVYDSRYQGRDVRVAQVQVASPDGGQVQVLVAETLIKRRSARADLLLTMAPEAALVILAAFIMGLAVRRTIGTLERIASGWNEQSHTSLEPIPIDGVPRELLPFATALNDLLQRVRAMLNRERQFAATVAHQLRTPLAGLRLGMARAAESKDLASMRSVLGELGDTTQRTARLVQQLLSLSRLDPEVRSGLHMVPVSLSDLAAEVGETYLDVALHKRIEIELDSADADVVVQGVPELLSEALGNLIDNALRYTPAGGRIVISVTAWPVCVSVSDSGAGIPEGERESVLERFVRGSTAHGEGSGLGLAIVKEIASLHGAAVSIAQSAWGGASVTIQFA